MFLSAVEHALERDRIARREAVEHADLLSRYCSLTPREQEVLPLLVNIMRKMKADSFAPLVRVAEKLNGEQFHGN